MRRTMTRREFAAAGAMALGAGLAVPGMSPGAAEPPPETTRLRILLDPQVPVLCWAPEYIALDFLAMEGITEVEKVPWTPGLNEADMIAAGGIDLAGPVATDVAVAVDRGLPIVALSGLHTGCIEMFAQDRIESLNDLKGTRVLSTHRGGLEHIFVSSVLAYVGLDPETDVQWVFDPDYSNWVRLFVEDKVDLVNAFTSLNYELRETGVGHVILNTTLDDPWRHFYCCMITGHRDFVHDKPVTAKRALRAIAKAQDFCTADPEAAARRAVALGATARSDFALRAMQDIPYGAWRDFDPAASLRFYALRLREAGMIGSTPREILERGTDFRILEELRTEMKT